MRSRRARPDRTNGRTRPARMLDSLGPPTAMCCGWDPLEPRLLLAATPLVIAEALDLPAGADVVYAGDEQAVTTRTLRTTDRLLNFPTGDDADFLVLSTGIADWLDTQENLGHGQGTDLGGDGLPDEAQIVFTVAVPASDRAQVLKFDFIFLSEEYDEWIGTNYDDWFTADAGGIFQSVSSTDVDFDGHLDTTGTYFDGRTALATAWYRVPALDDEVTITFQIADLTDGLYDSAVLIDNVRFEATEQVWLDFDGAAVGDLLGWGTNTTLPAFTPEDVRSTEARADLIADIVSRVEAKFVDYAIDFVADEPAGDDHITVVVGGSDQTYTHLDATVQTLKGLPANARLGDYLGPTPVLGFSDELDLENQHKANLCAVLSGSFATFGTHALSKLASVIAHQVGHSLGLRDVTAADDIMAADQAEAGYIGHDEFTYTVIDPAEDSDTATVYLTVGEQPTAVNDDYATLVNAGQLTLDVLGNDLVPAGGVPLLVDVVSATDNANVQIAPDGLSILYQAKLNFTGEDSFTYTVRDAHGRTDMATVTVLVDTAPEDHFAHEDLGFCDQDSDYVTIDVTANDTDGDDLLISEVGAPLHGEARISDDGSVILYRPATPRFRDAAQGLAVAWADGATAQNAHEYLGGNVLGMADDSRLERDFAGQGRYIGLTPLNITTSKTLYDVTLGVFSPSMPDIQPHIVTFDTLSGTAQALVPIYGPDTKIFLTAASRAGGALAWLSGTPEGVAKVTPAGRTLAIVGPLGYDAAMVDLLDGEAIRATLPLSMPRRDGQCQQVLNQIQISLAPSGFYDVDWLVKNTGRFTDSDNDTYTVRLTGGGIASVVLDDPDGDGFGPVQQVLLENTTSASKLTVTVRRGQGGDGQVDIGEIVGSALGGINAKAANITGKGVQIAGVLGGATLNELAAGSGIVAGGTAADRTRLTLGSVGDGSRIILGSTVTRLTIGQAGQARIELPALGTLKVEGDFSADLTLGASLEAETALGRASIGGSITGGAWDIVSGQVGSISVAAAADGWTLTSAGNVGSVQVGQLLHSGVYVGLYASFAALAGSDGRMADNLDDFSGSQLGKLTVKGIRGLAGGMEDSCVAASVIGTATINRVATDNGGRLFGLSADSIRRLSVGEPALRGSNLLDPDVISDDAFRILIL